MCMRVVVQARIQIPKQKLCLQEARTAMQPPVCLLTGFGFRVQGFGLLLGIGEEEWKLLRGLGLGVQGWM